MAKVRDGNIVLTDEQSLIVDNLTAVSKERKGQFSSIVLDSDPEVNITGFSTDGTLATGSDFLIPTQKAIKSYIGNNALAPGGWYDTAQGNITLSNFIDDLEARGIVYQTDCTTITEGFCIDTDGTDQTIGEVTITTAGTNYVVGDEVYLTGGQDAATLTVATIDAGGGITSVTITDPGTGYSLALYEVTSNGSGTGAQITVAKFGDYGKFYYYDNLAVVATPIDLLVGVQGNIQTQIDTKQDAGTSLTSLTQGDTSVVVGDTGADGYVSVKVDGQAVWEADVDGVRQGPIAYDLAIPDGRFSGELMTGFTAGEAIDVGEAVYLNIATMQWQLATRALATTGVLRGYATVAAIQDADLPVMIKGTVYDSTNLTFTIGEICLSTVPGGWTHCETEGFSRFESIGIAIHQNRAWFDFSRTTFEGTGDIDDPYTPPGADVCTTYFDEIDPLDRDDWSDHARWASVAYRGNVLDDNDTGEICEVSWYLANSAHAGAYDLYEYYTEVWLLSNVDDSLSEKVKASKKVNGADWGTGTVVPFAFESPYPTYDTRVDNRYAIVLKKVAKGDGSGANAVYSETNYHKMGNITFVTLPADIEKSGYWRTNRIDNTTSTTILYMMQVKTMQAPL